MDPRRHPGPARVYAYLAGDGYHHDAVDEALGDQLAAIYPGVRRLVATNRAYLADAVRLASSDLKIRQFLDLGSGFPGPGSVREAAQAADPAATVAAVDQDRAVGWYGSRLAREGVKGVNVVTADITDPAAVLAHPRVAEVIDLEKPACVVLGMVANAMEPERAREVTAGYMQAVAPGSALVVTAAVSEDERLSGALAEAWKATGRPVVNYTMAGVAALFGGLEVLPPGVGPVARAGSGRLSAVGEVARKMYAAGGIALKP